MELPGVSGVRESNGSMAWNQHEPGTLSQADSVGKAVSCDASNSNVEVESSLGFSNSAGFVREPVIMNQYS